MQLSIVTTLYSSSPYIEEFYKRIVKSASGIVEDFEIIFVNDGSPDDALEVAVELHQKDERVRVIDLSRNFGHHKAIMTGLSYARGENIFLIDVDLEEEPELLSEFWNTFHEHEQLDVVYGVQLSRKGGWFERLSGYLFYKVFNYISDFPLPVNFLTVRLMSKRYVKQLNTYDERVMSFSILTELVGFKGAPISVNKKDTGRTTYTFGKKLSLLAELITSTSTKPLKWIFVSGFIVALISAIFIVKVVLIKLFSGGAMEGWSSLIVSLWFIGGVTMMSLGVVGIYLSQIFTEVKKRPNSIIRKFYF